jgi:hypothetical protein
VLDEEPEVAGCSRVVLGRCGEAGVVEDLLDAGGALGLEFAFAVEEAGRFGLRIAVDDQLVVALIVGGELVDLGGDGVAIGRCRPRRCARGQEQGQGDGDAEWAGLHVGSGGAGSGWKGMPGVG